VVLLIHSLWCFVCIFYSCYQSCSHQVLELISMKLKLGSFVTYLRTPINMYNQNHLMVPNAVNCQSHRNTSGSRWSIMIALRQVDTGGVLGKPKCCHHTIILPMRSSVRISAIADSPKFTLIGIMYVDHASPRRNSPETNGVKNLHRPWASMMTGPPRSPRLKSGCI
jgi:hypothetical protein